MTIANPTADEVARELVYGDRQSSYGPPEVNFERVAQIWRVLFPERAWTAEDIGWAMIAVKLARQAEALSGAPVPRDTRDENLVDLIGYAMTIDRIRG